MKKWIRRSFKIRIFFTVLLVSLLPLLICDVIMLPLIIAWSESQLAEQARQQLNAARQDMGSLFQAFEGATASLGDNSAVRGSLPGGPAGGPGVSSPVCRRRGLGGSARLSL